GRSEARPGAGKPTRKDDPRSADDYPARPGRGPARTRDAMKRLLLLALIAFAAWYGWKHYAELRRGGSHDVVLVNHSGHPIERLRFWGAAKPLVGETRGAGGERHEPLRASHDGTFTLVWSANNAQGENNWTGGQFTHGPMLMT